MAKRASKSKTKSSKPTADKPTSGQSGPKIALAKDELNAKESAVLALLRRKGEATIAELTAAFPSKGKAKANSWVRNSLRRLVRARLAKKAGRGTYRKGG